MTKQALSDHASRSDALWKDKKYEEALRQRRLFDEELEYYVSLRLRQKDDQD